MKILIVQDYLRSGGTERHSIFTGAAAARAGHDVTLLTFRPGGALAEQARREPFRLRTLQRFDTGLDWLAPGLQCIAREIAPDLVLCMGHMANCYGGFLHSALPHAAVVGTLRDARPLPWLFRRSLRLSRHIIANSHAAKRTLTERYALPADKITVLHNPLLRPSADGPRNDTLREQLGAGPGTVVLAKVAMFRETKNHRELLQLCTRLPQALDWQLWLGGEGATLAATKQLCRELRLEPRVRFLGYNPNPAPIYQAADLAVLTSQSESLSNFLLEAQFYGLPAVAYNVSGVGECFLPDRSGCLITNRDQTAFITALEKLIRDAPLRRSYGEEARRFARQSFDPVIQAQAQLDLFAKLTGRA